VRTERVVTNRRCNQNCAFCNERSSVDDRAFIQRAAVERRIADAVAAGSEEIVLTGGEPGLRRDLGSIVAAAKIAGARRVVLETNGTTIVGSVAQLHAAGVDVFRVHVPAWGAALARVTRDPEAFAGLSAALSEIVAASAPLEIATPVVRSNLADVAAIPAGVLSLVADPRRVRLLLIGVPSHVPDADELVSFAEAAEAIAAIEAAARAQGLATKLAAGSGPPPCVFPKRGRPSHLWSLTGTAREREDHVRVAACADCLARESCAGLDAPRVARFGEPAVEPIVEERGRRRLALIATLEEQIAREFITFDQARDPVLGVVPEEIIRVNFHCNQACGFCFVSTHLPPPGHDAVIDAIEGALSRGARVVLSGGEPTLNPRLAEYVRLGSRGGTSPLQLQTNAIRFDDEAFARSLFEVGLREAFVSLHAGGASTSDALTGAPGTFARTVAGIDNLHRLGVRVTTNFVLCSTNAAEFPSYVRLVAERWPNSVINVSFVAPSTDVVQRDLVPRYSEVLPFLGEGLRIAEQLAISVRGFESMCGVPLCLIPDDVQKYLVIPEIPGDVDRVEFVETEACGRCSARTRCFGLRRGYADLHGVGELRPIASEQADVQR